MTVPTNYTGLNYCRIVQWDHVLTTLRSENIPLPPASELPQDSSYYCTQFGASPTTGILIVASQRYDMQKEAEQKAAIQKLTAQYKATQDNYSKLLEQYQQLLASYIAEKKAHDAETEMAQSLKQQMNDLLRILQEVGLM